MRLRLADRGESIARALLRPINPAVIIVLGLITFFWGVWVANPFWNTFVGANVYGAMDFMPESVWGAIAVLVAVLMIHGVIRNSFRSLLLGCTVAGFFWMIVSIFFFCGDYTNTGGIVYLGFALYCALIHVNLRANKVIYQPQEPYGL